MFKNHHPAFELVKPFNIGAGCAFGKNIALNGFKFGFKVVKQWKVTVNHRVHQRIKHKARAVAQ